MAEYRRWYQPGGTFFFTVVTYQRHRLFDKSAARELLGRVMREVADDRHYSTVAIVLLPDHLHCLWCLPPGDTDYADRWKEIKSRFTKRWLAVGGVDHPVSTSQAAHGRRGVWQRRYFEHMVRDEDDLARCCDYIHFNPVKHGYAACPWDWPWSSFRRFVNAGDYQADWGRQEPRSVAGLQWE
jgi:putative transposase